MDRFQPKVILSPTDFGELATFALEYAKDMARCSGAKLVVLYADPFLPPPHFTARQVSEVAASLTRSAHAARETLADYVRKHVGQAVEVESVVVEGLPVPAIINTAKERGADLIVMGTHGRSGLTRAMLGSVAERVLRETDRPVLTVRRKEDEAEPLKVVVRRVLCPVNYSEVAREALEHAVRVAECFKAELTVLHVIEEKERTDDAESQALSRWVPEGMRDRCRIREMIARGDAAEGIISAAERAGMDMIVLGAQHTRFYDSTVIGTTTVRVVRHAPCPVLTVIRK